MSLQSPLTILDTPCHHCPYIIDKYVHFNKKINTLNVWSYNSSFLSLIFRMLRNHDIRKMSDNGLGGANNEKYANKMSIKDKLLGIGINPRLGLFIIIC